MPDIYAQTLHHILTQYGRAICEEPRRLKALLADYLGKHPGTHEQSINVLLLALENRVVQDLLISDALPAEMARQRSADRLCSQLSLTENAASWAVTVWSEALGPPAVPGGLASTPQALLVAASTGRMAPTEGAPMLAIASETQIAPARDSRGSAKRGPLTLAVAGGLAGMIAILGLYLVLNGGSTPSNPVTPTTAAPKDDGWRIIFRSDNPSLWNDDINDKKHVAMALEAVPNDIRYLRMTNCSSQEFVIIAMSKERLGQRSDDGRYGWNGRNIHAWGGRQLGIYLKVWAPRKHGDVVVATGPPDYRGWGFGPLYYVNTMQGYTWDGQVIARTVFEIAVTSRELSDAEGKNLLKAGNPRQ